MYMCTSFSFSRVSISIFSFLRFRYLYLYIYLHREHDGYVFKFISLHFSFAQSFRPLPQRASPSLARGGEGPPPRARAIVDRTVFRFVYCVLRAVRALRSTVGDTVSHFVVSYPIASRRTTIPYSVPSRLTSPSRFFFYILSSSNTESNLVPI